jgi:hypothetical protein
VFDLNVHSLAFEDNFTGVNNLYFNSESAVNLTFQFSTRRHEFMSFTYVPMFQGKRVLKDP